MEPPEQATVADFGLAGACRHLYLSVAIQEVTPS
jgi:hypothetical protein